MNERNQLLEEMARLGIRTKEIAEVLGRDRTTIQKQLSGVTRLKPETQMAVERAIAVRRAGESVIRQIAEAASGLGATQVLVEPRLQDDRGRVFRPDLLVLTPDERVLSRLKDQLEAAEAVEESMLVQGFHSVKELIDWLRGRITAVEEGQAEVQATVVEVKAGRAPAKRPGPERGGDEAAGSGQDGGGGVGSYPLDMDDGKIEWG